MNNKIYVDFNIQQYLVTLLFKSATSALVSKKANISTQNAIVGTESAHVIFHLKNEMTEQPATLSSHFFYEKDERELRARDGSLDSQKRFAFATSKRVI